MTLDPSRRRFLAGCGSLPFFGTYFLAGCDGEAGPQPESRDTAAAPKTSAYYIDESGQVGLGSSRSRSFALGVLACTNGSESRHLQAIASIREAQGFRRPVFSLHGRDHYKERFAVALVEYLLGADELEYHALFLPDEVNPAGRRAEHFARLKQLHRDILDRRRPVAADRVFIARRTTDPAAMEPIRAACESAGPANVSVIEHKSSDLMQLCDYLTHAVRTGTLRNGRFHEKPERQDTRPGLAALLEERLGTSTLNDGSLEGGDTFSVTHVRE